MDECRRFYLYRREDVTGVSGTGRIAEGLRFTNGTVAMHWTVNPDTDSVTYYRSIEAVQQIHGHDGRTSVIWID